jgi:hypothetical protein
MGMPPETYLSEKLAQLVSKLRESLLEMGALRKALADIASRFPRRIEKGAS